jgi:5-methyltetrahydrofolate--homocysteine methyltransferase
MSAPRETFREAVRDRVLIFDGAMGSNLQAQRLTADDFGGKKLEGAWDWLVLAKPSAVEMVVVRLIVVFV